MLSADPADGAWLAPLVAPRDDGGTWAAWETPALDGERVLGLVDAAGKDGDPLRFLSVGAVANGAGAEASNAGAGAEAHIISCLR